MLRGKQWQRPAGMTIVHEFEVWDINDSDWHRQPNKGTEERIREAKGRIIPRTAEEVDSSMVDRFGSYHPADKI
jgi:hypothetical protein